jgi:hypothetical protein
MTAEHVLSEATYPESAQEEGNQLGNRLNFDVSDTVVSCNTD